MATALKVLIIEDNEDDAVLLLRELRRNGYEPQWRRVETLVDLDEALREPWDVVLSDYTLPGLDAQAALRRVQQHGLDVPFIIVSGTVGERAAVEAMRAGAHDYIVKGRLARLCAAVERELRDAEVRRQQQVMRQALWESEERFRRLADNAPDMIYRYRLTPTPGFDFVSQASLAMTGYSPQQFCDDPELLERLVHVDDRAQFDALLRGEAAVDQPLTLRYLRTDGKVVWTEQHCTPIRDGAGALVAVEGIARDVSDRLQLEEQLRVAQRMEAIGQLSGGIAHDFNNVLTVISSYCSFVLDQCNDEVRQDALIIQDAAGRAAELVSQLLAFSRRQIRQLEVLDLTAIVSDLHRMLPRLIGENIAVSLVLAPALWPVSSDRGQIEQILMNLAINARDAMPAGGRLVIETANVELDDAYVKRIPDARTGPHVMLAISDTGSGMTAEVRSRIFEPFFTTKERGKGTGLGLATVYGIVRQGNGHICVESEPGRGTTFKIHLPRLEQQEASPRRRSSGAEPPRPSGKETILLVEDEELVRRAARLILQRGGYHVLEACSGEHALELAADHEGPLDAMITDIVMQGISGRVLAERLIRDRPDLRVLYTSGYTDDDIGQGAILPSGAGFLPKPFTPDALRHKLREVLEH